MEPRKFRGSTSSPGHRSKAAAGSAATAGWIECAARLEVVSPLTKMPWPLIGAGASRHPHGRGADCRRGLSRDRKSVVSGKGVSVRFDLGGRRILKTKKKNNKVK